MLAFLYVKANAKEICEEISFSFFFQKSANMSVFLLRFKDNYLKKRKCVATPFFFVDANSPYKDLLFPHGPNLEKKNFVFSRHRP